MCLWDTTSKNKQLLWMGEEVWAVQMFRQTQFCYFSNIKTES